MSETRRARHTALHRPRGPLRVNIPIAAAPAFLEFLQREIGILPIWICPVHAPDPDAHFTLYPLAAGMLHVNFGFWDVVETRQAHEVGHFNRLIEKEMLRLGGSSRSIPTVSSRATISTAPTAWRPTRR